MADGRLIDQVLPVGVCRTQGTVGVAVLAPLAADEVAESGCVEHVDCLLLPAERHATVVRYLDVARVALLCRDDDDTIGTAATIDGGGRSVFQHVEGLDVLRVDDREDVGHTLHAIVVDRHVVDDDQRIVAGVEGRAATDADVGLGARRTTLACDSHTGHLTYEQVLGVDHNTLVLAVWFQGGDRSSQVLLLDHAVADDDHLVERLGRVILHGDDHVVLRRHLLLLVADVGDGQGLSGLHAEREVTVQVGHGTIARSVDQHARADNRLAGSIFHGAFHRTLGESTY